MSDTLYNYWRPSGSANDFKAALWACVSFTPTQSYVQTSVKIKVYRVGTFGGTVTVSLRACDGAHKPTGGDLAIAPTISPSAIGTGTSGEEHEFTWNTPVLLNSGTEYAIVARTSAGDSSHFLQWIRGSNEPTNYGWRSPDSGATWSQADLEFWFESYGVISIETFPASNILSTTATGSGYVEDTANIDEIGIEWGTTDGGPYPNEAKDTSGSYEAGVFAFGMTSLSGSTVHYYRAKMHHTTYGWIYGAQETFTTLSPLPQVQTDPPTAADTSSITAAGNITSTGGDANCDERGFVYGLTSQADPGNVAPGSSGYDASEDESGTFSTGSFSAAISGLTANRIYYLRAYAHNATYGYSYGVEILVLTSATVNILYPTSDSTKNVRFDSSPGGGYPSISSGTIAHYLLCRSADTSWTTSARWGYLSGEYAYERNHTNSNFYTDLFGLSNPIIRSGTVVKVKWKARLWRNSYPFGQYKRELYTNSTQYTGTAGDINAPSGGATNICEIFYTNPNTSAAWTIAELDALLAGVSLGNEGGYGIAALDRLLIYALWANAAVTAVGGAVLNPTTIRLTGSLDEDEGEASTVYFEWGATDSYGNSTAGQTDKVKGDTFTADITATPTIHFRAVIETACGETFYSSDFAFTGAGKNQVLIIP